jgi:uridine phosphorylase
MSGVGEEGRALQRSWYLRCQAGDVAERVVLVGDPGRVEAFARQLEGARTVNAARGLLTVTGRYHGVEVTVAAFGMGAPIMAVVLEEVTWLGARVVLRAGTAMALGNLALGDFIVPDAAIRGEHTSATYVPLEYPAVADPALARRAVEQVQALGRRAHGGLMASYDGFYSELFARDENAPAPRATQLLERLRDWGVQATDMETSALLAIGRYRGLRCATLCALTVEATGHRALEGADRQRVEDTLVQAALETLVGEPLETAAAQASGRQK